MSKNRHIVWHEKATFEALPYGFRWGALTVERLGSLPRGQLVIRLSTPKAQYDVRVTKTGKVEIKESGT